MNLVIKGAVGDFQYGLNKDGKCEWYVLNRKTGETVGTAENMHNALFKAKHFHESVQACTKEMSEIANGLTGDIKSLFNTFCANYTSNGCHRFDTTYGFLCIGVINNFRFEYYAATEGCEAHALITVGDMIKGEAR